MEIKREIEIKEEPLDAPVEDGNEGDLLNDVLPQLHSSQVCKS